MESPSSVLPCLLLFAVSVPHANVISCKRRWIYSFRGETRQEKRKRKNKKLDQCFKESNLNGKYQTGSMPWVLDVKSCSSIDSRLSLLFWPVTDVVSATCLETIVQLGTVEWRPVAFFRIWIGLLKLAVLSSLGLNHSVDLPEKAFSWWTWAKAHWISQQGSFWLW